MTLFQSKRTITLNTTGGGISDLAKALAGELSKDQLERIFAGLRGFFESYTVVTHEMVLSDRYELTLESLKSIPKSELAFKTAVVLDSETALRAYLDTLPPKAVDVFRAVYENVYLSPESARDIYGSDVLADNGRRGLEYYHGPVSEPIPQFAMLKIISFGTWTDTRHFLQMPKIIRKILGPILRPRKLPEPVIKPGDDEAEPVTHPEHGSRSESLTQDCLTLTEIPQAAEADSAGVRVFSAEGEMISFLPIMQRLYVTGQLENGKTKVTATTLKRLNKQLPFKEFFTDTNEKDLRLIAATLAATTFCLSAMDSPRDHSGAFPPAEAIARKVMAYVRKGTPEMFALLAGTFLSKPSNNLFDSKGFKALTECVTDALEVHDANGWITAEGLENHLRNAPDFETCLFPFKASETTTCCIFNSYSGDHIQADNIAAQGAVPMAQMIVGMLASLGIVEIVYTLPGRDAVSPMSGVRQMRLTPLGRYALGITGEYETSGSDAPWFVFDTRRLLMTATGENNPYEHILDEYVAPAGGRRFMASAEVFVSGCHDKNALINKIKFFRELVGVEMPPVWEKFLEDLVKKCDSISMAAEEYYVVQISPDDKELVSAISDDAELRELTICAEDYIVLVRHDHFRRFRNRLRHFGYIF